jgi:YbgC/YbaW family acyl-CoA thioester hydrolase
MTLLLRSLQTILYGLFQPKIKRSDETVSFTFRVLPIDIDIMWHMNHARYLNYMEAVRWNYLLRSGILKHTMKEKWLLPISKFQIEYLRPLKLWQKFTITAQLVRTDDKWLIIYHEVSANDKLVARALLRGMVKKHRTTIPPSELAKRIGHSAPEEPAKVTAWVDNFMQD